MREEGGRVGRWKRKVGGVVSLLEGREKGRESAVHLLILSEPRHALAHVHMSDIRRRTL